MRPYKNSLWAAGMLLLALVYLLPHCRSAGMIWPVEPVSLSVTESGSTTSLMVSIQVESQTPLNNYLRVTLANYTSSLLPKACYFGFYGGDLSTKTPCETVDATPNLYIQLPSELRSSESYSFFIELANTNPISLMSALMQVYTVSTKSSTNFFIFDYNLNFGQLAFNDGSNTQGNSLAISVLNYIDDSLKNTPGALNGISFRVFLNKAIPLKKSKLKIILSSPFRFESTAYATATNDPRFDATTDPTLKNLYKAPSVEGVTVDSPIELSVRFNEVLPENKAFVITVKNIRNPSVLSSSTVKVYTMGYTSNTYYEKNENAFTLQTTAISLKVATLLASGCPLVLPGGFYKGEGQYVRVEISSQFDIPAKNYLKLVFGTGNIITKGSVYVSENLTAASSDGIQYVYTNDQLLISNFASVTYGQTIVVQVRVRFAQDSAQFRVAVSADLSATATQPLFSGSSSPYDMLTNENVMSEINSNSIASSFVNNDDTTLTFKITPGASQTLSGAVLEMYLPYSVAKGATFSSSSSCKQTSNSYTFTNCVLEDRITYTYVKMASPIGANYFPIGVLIVQIENIRITSKVSNHIDNIWEFYGSLLKDGTSSAARTSFFGSSILVTKAATGIPDLFLAVSNPKQGNSDRSLPSVISIVGTSDTTNAVKYVLPEKTKRLITLFSYRKLNSILPTQASGKSYYCGYTFSTKMSCIYIEGHSELDSTKDDFVIWDRVHFYVPEEITTSKFRITIPDLYDATIPNVRDYVIALGYESTDNGKITYVAMESQTVSLSTASKQTLANLKIDYTGFAGRISQGVKFWIQTSSNLLRGNTYTSATSASLGAALIVNTKWEMWQNAGESKYNSAGSLVNSISNSKENGVTSFYYADSNGVTNYITHIPLTYGTDISTNIATPTPATSYFQLDIYNPYSLDLPDYSLAITNNDGIIDTWYGIINFGYNTFSTNALQSLSFDCKYKYNGYLNSICSIVFQPTNRIEPRSKFIGIFDGFTVKSSTCSVNYKQALDSTALSGSLSKFTCGPAGVGGGSVMVTLSEVNYFPSGNYYNLTIQGIDISSTTPIKTLEFQIKDYSENFLIETKKITISDVSPLQKNYFFVSNINFGFPNPTSYSTMNVTFEIPRALEDLEVFEIYLGDDIKDANPDLLALQYFLVETQRYTKILISVQSKDGRLIISFDNRLLFVAGQYILVVNGLKLPAGNENIGPKFFIRRVYDDNIVLENDPNNKPTVTEFVDVPQLNVKLTQARYLQEGHPSELTFEIIPLEFNIEANSYIWVRFPYYYSPGLVNNNNQLFCQINNINVPCKESELYPLMLQIYDIPITILQGFLCELKVYGIISPKNSNRYSSLARQETIFMAIEAKRRGYTEMAHMNPPAAGFIGERGRYLYFEELQMDVESVKAFTKHTLKVTTQAEIPKGGGLLANFPAEYSSLLFLSELDCRVTFQAKSTSTIVPAGSGKCSIIGKVFKMNIAATIPADSTIYWEIFNVPTPPNSFTMVTASFFLSSFAADGISVVAMSFNNLNRAAPIKIQQSKNTIRLNKNQDIIITKGTFSDLLAIETADGSRFLNNIFINSSAQGFEFFPSSFVIYLGDFNANFRIGVDGDVRDGLYPLSFTKKETGFSPIYGDVFEIFAYVVSKAVKIEIPATITVPRNGCSPPKLITVTSPPYVDIMIAVKIDEYPSEIYVDPRLGSFNLYFDRKNLVNSLVFCADTTFPANVNTVNVEVEIIGTNYNSYQLTNNVITLNIVDDEYRLPTLELVPTAIAKTSINLRLRTNMEGAVFWRLIQKERFDSGAAGDNSLLRYKLEMRRNNYSSLVIPNEFGESVEVWGFAPVHSFSTVNATLPVRIANLRPETTYVVFGYMVNGYLSETNSTNTTFTTQKLDTISKVNVKFSRKIFGDLVNNFMCFMVREFQSKSRLIIAAEGLSCSYDIDPTNYYFNYPGKTISIMENETNIYIVPDFDLENVTSLAIVNTNFDSGSRQVSSRILSSAQTLGLDFIQSMSLVSQFTYTTLKNAVGEYAIPSIKSISFSTQITTFNMSLIVQDLELTNHGSVFMIVQPFVETVPDPDNQGRLRNITLGFVQKPSISQIFNCQNHLNVRVPNCARAVYIGKKISIQFWDGIKNNTYYKLHYVITNQSPMEPIHDGTVKEMETVSMLLNQPRLLATLLGLALMMVLYVLI